MLPTASALERAGKCLASAILPRVDEYTEAADRGKAIHSFLARVAEVGRDAALDEVPEEYRSTCEVIDLDVLPAAGAVEVIAELAMAIDVRSGKARELGRNIGRKYPPLAPTEFGGSADIVTVSTQEALVADFKTGHGYVVPAAENAQLRMLGLAAGRLFRRQHVRVAIIRITEDGTPFFDSADYDAVELDGIEEDLRDLARRIENARDLLSIGMPPTTVVGPHCRRCKSLVYCPAQTMLVRKMVEDPEGVGDDITRALTPEAASTAWARLKVAEEVVRRAREAVYAYARETPIATTDGMVLGEVEVQRRTIDGKCAFHILRRAHGEEVAEIAVELEASQASIERALRAVAVSTGAKLAKLKREVLRQLEEAGGVAVRTSRTVKEYRPNGAQESGRAESGAAAVVQSA